MKSVSIGRILILMVVFSLPITILQTLFFSEKRWFSTAYPENHYPSANAVYLYTGPSVNFHHSYPVDNANCIPNSH